jgi:hypothetical protein
MVLAIVRLMVALPLAPTERDELKIYVLAAHACSELVRNIHRHIWFCNGVSP